MDILGLPPATRAYFIGCVATTALVHFDVVSPLYLYLNFNRITGHGELWRLVSNFFFFDYFSLNWLFHMLFLLPNAANLEKNHFRGRMSHFIWMIFVLVVIQLLVSLLLFYLNWHRIMFLGPSFSFGNHRLVHPFFRFVSHSLQSRDRVCLVAQK
jgi:Derlin-2/3